MRLRGVLEPSKEDLAEPSRTLRAIGESFKDAVGIRKDATAGDRHARLSCCTVFSICHHWRTALLLLMRSAPITWVPCSTLMISLPLAALSMFDGHNIRC